MGKDGERKKFPNLKLLNYLNKDGEEKSLL